MRWKFTIRINWTIYIGLTSSLLWISSSSSWLGFTSKVHEGGGPRRLQALSRLVRLMRDRQARLQRLQMKDGSRFGAAASRFFLQRLFSAMFALRVASNEETAWWMVWRQVSRSAVRIDHWLWSRWQAPRVFFKVSLKRFFGVPPSRWPLVIFGRRWSSILEICPS